MAPAPCPDALPPQPGLVSLPDLNHALDTHLTYCAVPAPLPPEGLSVELTLGAQENLAGQTNERMDPSVSGGAAPA